MVVDENKIEAYHEEMVQDDNVIEKENISITSDVVVAIKKIIEVNEDSVQKTASRTVKDHKEDTRNLFAPEQDVEEVANTNLLIRIDLVEKMVVRQVVKVEIFNFQVVKEANTYVIKKQVQNFVD